jgi:predicted ribonuclease YlaK
LLGLEIEDRIAAFSAAHAELDQMIQRWDRNGHFVVPDTSVFIESAKIEELDFVGLVEFRGAPVHLLVPLAVIDELDGLKRYGSGEHRGWRARYTLAVLDRVLGNPTSIARLRDEDFSPLDSGGIPRGEVTVEILFDPPGHERLPILDDEIVSRALAAQTMAGRSITMLTHDTGQAMRSRAAGLATVKIPSPPGGAEPRRK